jgi:hypothetical protein
VHTTQTRQLPSNLRGGGVVVVIIVVVVILVLVLVVVGEEVVAEVAVVEEEETVELRHISVPLLLPLVFSPRVREHGGGLADLVEINGAQSSHQAKKKSRQYVYTLPMAIEAI